MSEPMAVAADGERLTGFDVVAEPGIEDAEETPLTASLVIVERDGAVLLVHDRWKQSWELPGGGREPGETPRQTAIRELAEESGVETGTLVFAGVSRYVLQPDGRGSGWPSTGRRSRTTRCRSSNRMKRSLPSAGGGPPISSTAWTPWMRRWSGTSSA